VENEDLVVINLLKEIHNPYSAFHKAVYEAVNKPVDKI
jgi:hypothetical protein